jgi:hypothetical protein
VNIGMDSIIKIAQLIEQCAKVRIITQIDASHKTISLVNKLRV